MRAWTKSACVVLAWSILSIILVLVGVNGSVQPAWASTRTASSTEVRLISTPAVTAARVTATSHLRYVVQDGDTLSGIAARFSVRGGWPALYAANRRVVGPDPNVIHAGTVLTVPVGTGPVRYTVAAGDTLSGIAAAFAVRGGWPALYAANRQAIGPDPNDISAGTVLMIPRRSAPSRTRPTPSHSRPPAPAPAPSGPAVPAHDHAPASKPASAAARMPQWLKLALLAVGLLILAAFAAEPVLAVRRRRRQLAAAEPSGPVGPGAVPVSEQPCTRMPGIVFADHDRLVVTRNKRDDSVCVLRPPDEDPKAILRVARLVLPERHYGELAQQLGLPARWPME